MTVGMGVNKDDHKRALLLHYAGERVYDIYQAEKGTSADTYDDTKAVLMHYFAQKKECANGDLQFSSM